MLGRGMPRLWNKSIGNSRIDFIPESLSSQRLRLILKLCVSSESYRQRLEEKQVHGFDRKKSFFKGVRRLMIGRHY